MKNQNKNGFEKGQNQILDNLDVLKLNLEKCVDDGMLDTQDEHYNQLLILIDEATLSKTWDELQEVITKAKVLEIEIDAWFANHGITTISLSWPK